MNASLRSKRSLVRIQPGVPTPTPKKDNQPTETKPVSSVYGLAIGVATEPSGDGIGPVASADSVRLNSTGPVAVAMPLSGGVAALVDEDDYAALACFKWSKWENGSGHIYAARRQHGRVVYLHRLIMGAAPGQVVDHRNGDTLDCRKSNLRLCRTRQNNQNRAKAANRSNPYKGVDLRQNGKWRAKISVGKRTVHLGYHDTPELAARAYDAAAVEHFGEFARLNFGGAQ